jgi:hypothetical protein
MKNTNPRERNSEVKPRMEAWPKYRRLLNSPQRPGRTDAKRTSFPSSVKPKGFEFPSVPGKTVSVPSRISPRDFGSPRLTSRCDPPTASAVANRLPRLWRSGKHDGHRRSGGSKSTTGIVKTGRITPGEIGAENAPLFISDRFLLFLSEHCRGPFASGLVGPIPAWNNG